MHRVDPVEDLLSGGRGRPSTRGAAAGPDAHEKEADGTREDGEDDEAAS